MFNSGELSSVRMVAVAFAVLIALAAPAAHAQAEVSVPTLQPTLRLEDVPLPPDVPGPCAEFGCYNGSILDGDTVAASGDATHQVYVFTRAADGKLTFQALLSNPELVTPDDYDFEFGVQLALSGDVLMASGTFQGVSKVYVFRRHGATWSYQQTLQAGAFMGIAGSTGSLLISHRTAFVGTGVDVRVFEPNARGVFRQTAVLKPPVPVESEFGSRLSFDGLTALVGAPHTLTDGVGAAYAFDRFFGFWIFVQKFTPASGAADSSFASGVAIDHGLIAIGDPWAPGLTPSRFGIVQTYARRGWQWRPADTLTNPIPVDDGEYRTFGDAVDLQGSRLLATSSVKYPYAAPRPMNYLFELRGTPHIIAALNASGARSVYLSGHTALIDQQSIRVGTYPALFDLPN
jgi:hypothetical protein